MLRGSAALAALWLPQARRSEAKAHQRVDMLIELMGLEEHEDKVMSEVSELSNENALILTQQIGNGQTQTLTIPSIKTRRAETTLEIPSGGSLAMAGLIPFSGYWAKDEILVAARHYMQPGNIAILILLIASLPLTAAYMYRVYSLTFEGAWAIGRISAWNSLGPMSI